MSEDKEISLPVALLMLFSGVLLLIGLQHKDFLIQNKDAFIFIFKLIKSYLITYASLIFINLILLSHYLRRLFALSKQGDRLRAIKKEQDKKWVFFRVLVFLLCGAVLGYFLERALLNGVQLKFPNGFGEIQYWFFVSNVAFLFWFVADRLTKLFSYLFFSNQEKKMPNFKNEPDSIVLGSVNEDESENPIKWAKMPRRGLNGSILITGSIGSGKTSGAVLSFFKQCLLNFDKMSILALDPKRTFISEASDLIKKHKSKITVHRMTLDGQTTYNPVYVEGALKKARFIDIAEMVRSSSVNFSGGGSGSPFWELSAFNLIKNAIVYCAAIKGYFTLPDIYETMINAVEEDLAEELEALYKPKDKEEGEENKSTKEKKRPKRIFDEEEIYNINCSVEYFKKEFRNMDQKIKTSILATATSFLNQFQEYRAAKIFCPKKEDRTILSIDSIVDNGEVLLFDIESPALARAMGTIIKLQYQQSVLSRVVDKKRGKDIPAIAFLEEFQGVVTSGGGKGIDDGAYLAKARESNSITFAATQSVSSLQNTLRNADAVAELVQNFRTRIAFHSADLKTIDGFKKLVGQDDMEKESRSISEIAQKTERNYLIGGFDAKNANISESVNTSKQKEFIVTGKEFTALKTFEALALVFDGVSTTFNKLYMKPYFLDNPKLSHEKVLELLEEEKPKSKLKVILGRVGLAASVLAFGAKASAFPNICDVLKQPSFRSCMQFRTSPTMCGSFPPRPCARISYYVPQTFIETSTKAGVSHFSSFFGAAIQLASVSKKPYGSVNDDDSQSFHGRTIGVPLAQLALSGLPCGGVRQEKMCFDGMSEHISEHWATGRGDLLQPKFLAWKLSPKACMIKGAITTAAGAPSSIGAGSLMCSMNMDFLSLFPPSTMPVCTSWGVMFPRVGTQVGGSEVIGSLSAASRIKSLSVEVFNSMPSSFDEKWSMISPNASRCFREFENIASIETFRQANNRGRVTGKNLTGNLYATWKKVSCTKDWAEVPFYMAEIAILEQICKAL